MAKEKNAGEVAGKIIGEIIGFAITVFILTNITRWNLPFITDDISAYVPVGLAAAFVTMIFHSAGVLTRSEPFRLIFESLADIASIVSMVVLVQLFPFTFGTPAMELALKIAFWFVIAVLAIKVIVQFVKIIIPACKR